MATLCCKSLQSHIEKLGDAVLLRRKIGSHVLLKAFLTFQVCSFASFQLNRGFIPFHSKLSCYNLGQLFYNAHSWWIPGDGKQVIDKKQGPPRAHKVQGVPKMWVTNAKADTIAEQFWETQLPLSHQYPLQAGSLTATSPGSHFILFFTKEHKQSLYQCWKTFLA